MSEQNDINQIIVSAVNARVEAEVAAALTNADAMKTFVEAALHEKVKSSDRYGADDITLVTKLVRGTVVEQTKKVVAEEVQAQEAEIRAHVRQAVQASVGVIADSLVDGFMQSVTGKYPSIKVTFNERS